MTKKFKRGYIEFNKYYNSYVITITEVVQSNELGKFEDVDEDQLQCFRGYESIEEAKKDLLEEKVKEIIIEK